MLRRDPENLNYQQAKETAEKGVRIAFSSNGKRSLFPKVCRIHEGRFEYYSDVDEEWQSAPRDARYYEAK